MDPITEEQLKDLVREKRIKSFSLGKCTFCKQEQRFEFDREIDRMEPRVIFQDYCTCQPSICSTSLKVHPWSYVVSYFNIQTPEERRKMWEELSGTDRVYTEEKPAELQSGMKTISLSFIPTATPCDTVIHLFGGRIPLEIIKLIFVDAPPHMPIAVLRIIIEKAAMDSARGVPVDQAVAHRLKEALYAA